MIGITLKETILFFILLPIWILFRAFKYVNCKRKGIKIYGARELFINITFIYLLYLASITIFPLNIMFKGTNDIKPVANLIPIVGKMDMLENISKSPETVSKLAYISRFIIWNSILLFPLSIFLPLLWKKFREMKNTVLFCFCIILFFESFPHICAYWGTFRNFDIDIIIFNTLSALIGYVFYDKVLKKARFVRTYFLIE
jgi:Glycopeptide antibiotics resistance protein